MEYSKLLELKRKHKATKIEIVTLFNQTYIILKGLSGIKAIYTKRNKGLKMLSLLSENFLFSLENFNKSLNKPMILNK